VAVCARVPAIVALGLAFGAQGAFWALQSLQSLLAATTRFVDTNRSIVGPDLDEALPANRKVDPRLLDNLSLAFTIR